MLPVFHADNLKTWKPPFRTRSSSKRSRLHPSSNDSPAIKFPQSPLPQALPLPNHQLPARPPAESPSQKPSRLHSATTPATSSDMQHAERLEQSLRNRAGPSSNSDLSTSPEVHNATDASIDVPFFPEDALTYISSPNQQNGIPIDPVILTNNGPWEAEDERQHIHADVDANRNSNAYPEAQEGSSRLDGPPHNQSHAQVSANNNPEAHIRASSNPREVPTSGQQSKRRKRKLQQLHGQPQQCKRVRGSSATASEEHSFSLLRSHFTSVLVDECLQFLTWLFEGALPRCMSEFDLRVSECIAQPTHYVSQPADSTALPETSRKGMPWSSEEIELLLRLRRDEKRAWSEVTRLFLDQFPGRSRGSIQVYWSTTLKNRAR
ncbi:SANT/Myb-like DNA-binding domain-containing protein [Aspergillus novofumigatus IBT 16806]|uniref:Myb-like domain-containing protein n=1 Tax=Aspergillus novofumigatus (strain IBT 16806) TaxID=1392255 RepID=A0A2I1BUP6_ASPN1|nr:uncharacterized protein P174DRAFT_464824 [Aspergillus novofumigatus IBT 16806]PKX89123.1 hypothetical protein P174DRAFT_464824 [Aspergillus novofumigatus IBT 16806]